MHRADELVARGEFGKPVFEVGSDHAGVLEQTFVANHVEHRDADLAGHRTAAGGGKVGRLAVWPSGRCRGTGGAHRRPVGLAVAAEPAAVGIGLLRDPHPVWELSSPVRPVHRRGRDVDDRTTLRDLSGSRSRADAGSASSKKDGSGHSASHARLCSGAQATGSPSASASWTRTRAGSQSPDAATTPAR
ncbi:MAG TPA: hypothetical protein VFI65_31615 [Streptosporangiaceae bacterium]|nr:hypothetical protein [Streptosporangiaceae bacterium]